MDGKRLKVLLVEDNPGDARLVERHLDPGVDGAVADVLLDHEPTLEDGLDALETGVYDVLFLDLGLPESRGLDTLDRVLSREPGLPIVVLTGLDDRETAVAAIQRGAQDYLPKDNLDAPLLARTLRYAVERHNQEEILRRKNERLARFTDVVSHDLRNPLNVAQGHVRLLDGSGSRVRTIERNLDRMEEIIEDMLALARQGQSVEETEPVALGPLVRDCWATVPTAAGTLEVATDVTVEADETRLRQALENVLRNAVEHGGDGVTVRVGAVETGFFVEDDGAGIPEAEREAVFETGFTTDTDGTGLGLEIVREVAEAHGWRVAATEGDGGGTRVEFVTRPAATRPAE